MTAPLRSTRPRAILAALLSLLWGAQSGRAWADDDSTPIDLSGGVPDRAMPFGHAFSVNIPVQPSTTSAFGVFFEYSHKVWGIGGNETRCAAIANAVTSTPELLLQYRPGRTELGRLFHAKAAKSLPTQEPLPRGWANYPALGLSTWERPSGTDATTKVATLKVPGVTFFQPGARYCFIAVQASDLKASVLPQVEALARTVQSCVRSLDSKQAKDVNARNQCVTDATDDVLKKIGKDVLVEQEIKAAKASMGPLVTLAWKQNETESGLRELLDPPVFRGLSATGPRGPNADSLDPWTYVKVPDLDAAPATGAKPPKTEFMMAVFAELVRHGYYVKPVGPEKKQKAKNGELPPPAVYVHVGADGDKAVSALRLDGTTIHALHLVSGSKTPRDEVVDVKLSQLQATPNLSFADLVVLGNGAIPVEDGSSLSFRDVLAKVESVTPTNAADTLPPLELIARRLDVIENDLDPAKNPETSEMPAAQRLARRWFADVEQGTLKGLHLLKETLHGFSGSLGSWTVENANVEAKLGKIETAIVADVSTGLTEDTWFANYVLPTVGYTIAKDVMIPTSGIQVFFFPNVTTQPMWTNGAGDWRRAFSIQLALGINAQKFGPEDRYSGPGRLPPITVGPSLHLIPWTNISFGALIFESRHSTLPDEKPKTRALPYIDFAVQLNVPDMIRQLINPTSGKKE